MSSRGIYLVANEHSEELCESLIYSIRSSGCSLPIRLLPYGGRPVRSKTVLQNVEAIGLDNFPQEGRDFIDKLTQSGFNPGLVRRFLAWYGDWDEFIYSDNDIVALCNWEILFDFLDQHDLVHADREYLTEGKFNYHKPQAIRAEFGEQAMDSLVTAGHFLGRRGTKYPTDILQAVDWFQAHQDVPKWHDQALLHVAILKGSWKVRNLCKEPYCWLSPFSGAYRNTLDCVQSITRSGKNISHIHYAGQPVYLSSPMDDFLLANKPPRMRLLRYILAALEELCGINRLKHKLKRLRSLLRNKSL